MHKFVSAALSAAIVATGFVASTAPADAQRGSRAERERYVERYCDRNPRDRDCRDFRNNRHRWDDRRYSRWYRDHHRGRDDDNPVAELFGLAAGAVSGAAGAVSRGSRHAACEAKYRTYDSDTGKYRGRDGRWHRCQL